MARSSSPGRCSRLRATAAFARSRRVRRRRQQYGSASPLMRDDVLAAGITINDLPIM
jgi:hypothetical protein